MSDGTALIIRCREINDIAQHASGILLDTLRVVSAKQKIYTFKNRIKSPKAIWLKVHRNRREAAILRERHTALLRSTDESDRNQKSEIEAEIAAAESFGPDNVWDAWGCRYVTLFEDQRPALVRDLFEKIESFNTSSTVPAPVTLLRCSIHYTEAARGSKDRALEIKNMLCDSEFAPKTIPNRDVIENPIQRDGYSSAHFNFEVPIIMDFPRGPEPPPIKQSYREIGRFEIQVRDVFEEAWSEAEHYLFYSYKDDVVAQSTAEIDALQRAKELVDAHRGTIDATRTWISTIKHQIDQTRRQSAPNVEVTSTTPRADDRAEIVAAIKNRVSSETLDALNSAYDSLHDAESAKTKDEVRKQYAAAAAAFERVRHLFGKIAEVKVLNRGNMPIRYFIDMEMANSYIFSEQADGVSAATLLYRKLLKSYPNDPTLRYRYARAITRFPQITSDDLKTAHQLVRDIPKLVRSDPLTGPHHWLSMAAAILEGYIHYYWAKSYEQSHANDAGEHFAKELKAATETTSGALEFWDDLSTGDRGIELYQTLAHKAASNVAFYVANLRKLGQADENALRAAVAKLESIPLSQYFDLYKSLDNKMHALVALGDASAAVELAKKIYEQLQAHAQARAGRSLDFREIAQHLDNDERTNFKAAVNVLFSEGKDWH